MTGYREMEEHIIREIDRIICKDNDKAPVLRGYANFSSHLALTSIRFYMDLIVKFLNYVNKTAEELTYDDYADFWATLRYAGQSKKRAHYCALKSFSKYLRVSGRNLLDPMREFPAPRVVDTVEDIKKREANVLSLEETKQILAKIPYTDWGIRDRAIIMVLLTTGIRCSALARLDVDSIDLKKRTLEVIDKGSKIQKHMLTHETINIIKEWLEIREMKNKYNSNALFLNKNFQRMSRNSVSEITRKYPTDSGKRVSAHKFRATYCSLLLDKTGDIYFVQQCMGHSSPVTTERYVRGRGDKDKKRAVEIMEELF